MTGAATVAVVTALAGVLGAIIVLIIVVRALNGRVNRVLSLLDRRTRDDESTASRLQAITDSLASVHGMLTTVGNSLAEFRLPEPRAALEDLAARVALQHSAIATALHRLSSRLDMVTAEAVGDLADRLALQQGATATVLHRLSAQLDTVTADVAGLGAETRRSVEQQSRLGDLAAGVARLAEIGAALDAQRDALAQVAAEAVRTTTNVKASRDELGFLLHSGLAQIDEAARLNRDELARCATAVRDLAAIVDGAADAK